MAAPSRRGFPSRPLFRPKDHRPSPRLPTPTLGGLAPEAEASGPPAHPASLRPRPPRCGHEPDNRLELEANGSRQRRVPAITPSLGRSPPDGHRAAEDAGAEARRGRPQPPDRCCRIRRTARRGEAASPRALSAHIPRSDLPGHCLITIGAAATCSKIHYHFGLNACHGRRVECLASLLSLTPCALRRRTWNARRLHHSFLAHCGAHCGAHQQWLCRATAKCAVCSRPCEPGGRRACLRPAAAASG